MKKLFRFFLIVSFLSAGPVADAQQAKKVARIGFLGSTRLPTQEAFGHGLRELGYIEGQNILVEYRYAEGKLDRLPELAAELVRLKVDVIVAVGPAVRAAKQATNTIPIVAASGADLVASGFAASLAQPGGNVTGTTNIDMDLTGKRLELLKETFPKFSRVAILHGGAKPDHDEVKESERVAKAFAIKIQPLEVHDPSQIKNAFATMTKGRAEALIIFHGSVTLPNRSQILELANKNRLPTMCGVALWSEDGCLMSYGADEREKFRRAASFVDKILKGRTPADLPVEQPMKFEFIINLKTAKQIGVTIEPNVLVRANRVIR